MKQISVDFTEPIPYTKIRNKWNKEAQRWEEVEEVEMVDHLTFFTLAVAKKVIKANISKYKSSCITKIWANGDWENLGEVQIKGNNKHFVANTRQKDLSYA